MLRHKITAPGMGERKLLFTSSRPASGSTKSAQILEGITSKSTATPDAKSATLSSTTPSASSEAGKPAKASLTPSPATPTAPKKNLMLRHDTDASRAGGAIHLDEELEATQQSLSTPPSSSPSQESDDESSSCPRTLKRCGARIFTLPDSDSCPSSPTSLETRPTNGCSATSSASGEEQELENHGVFARSAQRLGSIFGSLQPLPEDCGLMATTVTLVRSSTVSATACPAIYCSRNYRYKTLTATCHGSNCSASSKATSCKCKSRAVMSPSDLVWSTLLPTVHLPAGPSASAKEKQGKGSTKRGSTSSCDGSATSKKSRVLETIERPST